MTKCNWLRATFACFLAFAGSGCRSVDIESAQRGVVETWDRGTRDPRSEIRVLTTTWIGLYAELSLGYLDRALEDPDPEVRRAAVARLRFLSEAVAGYLKHALSNPSAEVRTMAHRELVAVGADVRNVTSLMKDQLREALRHPEASERRWAAWLVANHQDLYGDVVDSEALPAVIEASRDPEWFLRIWAVKKLGELGPGAVPRLTEALDDPELAYGAAESLFRLGPAALPALPALVRTARGEHWHAADWAIAALGEIGPEAKEVVPLLVEAIRAEGDQQHAYAAAEALGKIGVRTADVIAALESLHADAEPKVREAAERALEGLR